MPHSWIRVPNGASPKVHKCMEDEGDTSRSGFDKCVKKLVAGRAGCSVEQIYYEANGKWARVLFEWDSQADKTAIIFDLQGEDVIDLLTLSAVNKLGH